MSNSIFARFTTSFSAIAAAALALSPGHAHATTYSGGGWVQLQKSAGSSVSTTQAGYDFGIGYTAFFGIEGYNWDVATDTVTVTCESYVFEGGIFDITLASTTCPGLPGSVLSSTTTSASATYAGIPCTKKTKAIVYDVPDVGAMSRVDGYFTVPVTLFDEDFDLFKLTGAGVGNTHGTDSVSASVYVLGAKLLSGSATLPATTRVAEYCETLAEAEAEFSLAGVPINVTASADGCIYVDASASWGSRALSATVTPGALVDATLKVGIGFDAEIVSAEAGVYGTITVIDASVPVMLSAAVGASAVTVSESATLTMTGLDGEAGLYAEGCFLFWCDEETKTIFDWSGMTYANASIFSASQTLTY